MSFEIKQKGTARLEATPLNPHVPVALPTPLDPLTDDEETKKNNRFYLPVLYINDPTMWPSQPMENRRHFTDKVAYDTCIGSCCGVDGLKAGCCHMDPNNLEHVLGPLDEDWIRDIVRWFRKKGFNFSRSDIVIDYEEGKIIGQTLFNGHPIFQKPDSYPILRFQVTGPRFSCKFLNTNTGKCTIYERRPNMCRDYLCQYVKNNFLIRTKAKPNTYIKAG